MWPLSIDNRTDTSVYVYEAPDCSGGPSAVLHPQFSATFESGSGVYVPQ